MNRQFLVTVIGGSAIASILGTVLTEPSYAQNQTIDCITPNTAPTTRIRTPLEQGKQEVLEIHWYKKFGMQQARQQCQQTAEKMRRYTQNGGQFYINRGQIGRKFVLCLVRNTNDRCTANSDFLFEPRTENNPNQFLSALFHSYIITVNEGSVLRQSPNRRSSWLSFLIP